MVVVLWQYWGEHVGQQLSTHLAYSTLADVTISVGTRSIKAHRIILSFFSPFFQKMLEDIKEERPMVIVFPGVNYEALQIVISYMYRGQVNITRDLLPQVVELAKMLKVRGLLDLQSQMDELPNEQDKDSHTIISRDDTHLNSLSTSNSLVELEVNESSIDNGHFSGFHLTNEISSLNDLKSTESGDVNQPVLIQFSTLTNFPHSPSIKAEIENVKEIKEELLTNELQFIDLCESQTVKSFPKIQRTRKKRQKYKSEDIKGAVEDLKSRTKTLRQIAAQWGIPRSSLALIAKELGIVFKNKKSHHPVTLLAAVNSVKDGSSYADVSRKFNIPKSVIWRTCQKEGIIMQEVPKTYTQNSLDDAKQMFIEGKRLCFINKELNIPKATLFRLKEHLIKEGKLPESTIQRYKRMPKTPEIMTKIKEAIHACQNEGITTSEAAQRFEVSHDILVKEYKKIRKLNPSTKIKTSITNHENDGKEKIELNLNKTEEISLHKIDKVKTELIDVDIKESYSDVFQYTEDPMKQKQTSSSNELCHAFDTSHDDEIFATNIESNEDNNVPCSSEPFEIEMPLVNLTGQSYQVVGSEIVIDGQQVVVLEPSVSEGINADVCEDENLNKTSIVVGTFDENCLVELQKVPADDDL